MLGDNEMPSKKLELWKAEEPRTSDFQVSSFKTPKFSKKLISKKLTKDKIIKAHIARQMSDIPALQEVLDTVLRACERLPVGLYVSAAQLVPYEQWIGMTIAERCSFGRRLSLLVTQGQLPLARVELNCAMNRYLTT